MTDYNVMKDFTFTDRDEFSRKPIAEKIIKLLDSAIDVSPLIIDGKWGTGKTEFCFKLKNLIEANNSNNYKVGYINAFQADHANEPLLTLIAEVASFYEENDDKRKNFIRDAIPYLRLVSGIGMKAIASLAFGKYGANIGDDFKDGIEDIENGTESLIDQSLESMIKDQVEAEKNLSTLREALSDIATTKPIILLIDELDRCRPDFAVMMLETIKHVFDVENVKIILITNAEQLKATIKHSYGSETDSHSYLYKFFKYQINLPTSIKDVEGISIENNVTYFKTTIKNSNVISKEFKDNEFVYKVPEFLSVGTLSLRNIEQIVRCIETLAIFEDKTISQSFVVEQILIVFLSFVYMMDKNLLQAILSKKVDKEDFLLFINTTTLNLPKDYAKMNDLDINILILLILNSRCVKPCLYIPTRDSTERRDSFRMINQSVIKYNFVEKSQRATHLNSAYINKYIDHTINNLLLFDIVK